MKMQPILAHLRPMSTDDYPMTDETLRLSKEARARELAKAAEVGVFVDANGRAYVLPDGCAEAVDQAVEDYGLESVIRAVRRVATMNGRTL